MGQPSNRISPPSTAAHGGGGPVNLLVLLHKAFRRELSELRRLLVVEAAEFDVLLFKSRVEFFRRVYKYHCAAEAEVLFLALDTRVENIAGTYYLQHHSTDSMFESVSSCLDGLGYLIQDLKELITHIGILQDSICQHMLKEEKQVFPLLISHFSDEEQASLVWQFICRFPVMLLEDFFPWFASLLPPEEQLDLKECISNILLRDKSTLHETVTFWIDKAAKKSQDNCNKNERSSQCPHEQNNLRDMSARCLLKNGPFGCLLLLNAAIKSDLEKIMNNLDQAKRQKFPSLSSLIIQIKFLNEVLVFYSDILEKVFYPLVEVSSLHHPSSLYRFPHKNHVEGLQKILYDANKIHEPTFLKSLYSQMESLVLATTEHLSFQETEVFPFISEECNIESQMELLIGSLRTLPLGLLKCVVTWFSSHLPKNELKFILHGIGQSCVIDKPFASLLHDWVHAGYSGKTNTENLEEIFNRRVPFLSELIRDDNPCKNLKQERLNSLGSSETHSSYSMSKSNDTNLVMFPSRTVSYNFLDPRPMDHIYYFHKAIKKDLESLVLGTTKLSKNLDLLKEFIQLFCFVRSSYELHSETEDKIAFPALEANLNARNITQSYSIDHEMETQYFERASGILDEMSGLYDAVSHGDVNLADPAMVKYHQLCLELEHNCKSLKKILEDHVLREETELWPLFREYFSIDEQEKILGYMLGRTRAEILQKMMLWLMAHSSLNEQQAMMNYWRKATYSTHFSEWLGEWWEDFSKYDFDEEDVSSISPSATVSGHLVFTPQDVSDDWSEKLCVELLNDDCKVVKQSHGSFENTGMNRNQFLSPALDVQHPNKHLVASWVEQEAANKGISRESILDLHTSSKIIQNATTSICLASVPRPNSDDMITTESGKLQGQFPSFRDNEGSVFGCKHYRQNCKLVASCCNRIFTCRRCHDEEIHDHVMDRKSTVQMMCMRCLEVQPIGRTCSTPSCNGYSMARYYCRICRLFDDKRQIYHCPYCNLCRVGRGLGIDYYHCMKCNACNSRYRPLHVCIEKCIEDRCPICQEDMFTSTNPVKSLPCGHVMHSTCFQDYTRMRYTCPICSKSLADMQVYNNMLDALLSAEEMPEEYRVQTQAILCNDCEKKGNASFHWVHHKCSYCGSYNTRVL